MPISNMDHVPAQEADQPDQNTAERQQRPRLQWQSAARQQEAPCNFQASRVRATSRHRPGYVGSASLLACTSKVHASFVPSRKTVCHLHGSDSIHQILGLRNTQLQIFTSSCIFDRPIAAASERLMRETTAKNLSHASDLLN